MIEEDLGTGLREAPEMLAESPSAANLDIRDTQVTAETVTAT